MSVYEVVPHVLLVFIISGVFCSKEIKVITKAFEFHFFSKQLSYCKLNKEMLEQTHFIFEVKSCSHARVILAEQYDSLRPSTEIIINKFAGKSHTRICFDYPCDIKYHKTGELLNCTSFQPFWISWSKKIKFGKGLVVSQHELMSSNLNHSVNYLGLQTISNNTDEWIVYQERIVLDMKDDINCIAFTNYSQTIQRSTEDKQSKEEQELGPQSKITECECKCQIVPGNPWKHLIDLNLTFDETKAVLKESLDELKMNIKVNPRKTTRYNTTKTCATDDRLSATVAGWIGGCIIALVPTLVIISDVFKYCL